MTEKGWSNIHDEVKVAKSMKTTVVVWVLGWNKTKGGKNSCCSLFPYDYTYAL